MRKFYSPLIIFAFLFFQYPVLGQTDHVVISEVYGGGGNVGATFKNDFIELYNPTASPISLSGWSVQYSAGNSAATTNYSVTPLSGSIPAYGYYLIQQAAGSGGTADLPTPDVTGTIAMAQGAGKVALVSNTTAITTNPGSLTPAPPIVDFVGYGTTGSVNSYEGSGRAPAPDATSSVERKAISTSSANTLASGGTEYLFGNSYDTDNNNTDFVAQVSINPQNSSSSETPSTVYYSNASGDLNVLSTWGTNADGTGANPTTFLTYSSVFNISNRTTAALSSPWLVGGQLVLTNTITNFNTNGLLTLVSTSTGTGRIGVIPAGTTVTGDVTVQRYIPSKAARKWSFVASPVAGPTIRTGWQDDVFITGFGSGGTPCGTGTGNGGVSDRYNINGFDDTQTDFPSMFKYSATPESGSRWVSIPNTSELLVPGKGYRMNIRGPRGADDANCSAQINSATPPLPTEATLSATGTLIVGSYDVNIFGRTNYNATSPNNAYTLVGNPYASEISTKSLQAANSSVITTSFYYYSPQSASNSYATYNIGTNQALNFPAGYTNGTVSDVIIASGQSFFVERAADADANLNFQESMKTSTGTSGNTFFRVQNITNKVRIAYQSLSDNVVQDELYINYLDEPAASFTEYTKYDTRSFSIGNTYSLASLKQNIPLTIQSRGSLLKDDTVRLSVVGTAGSYKYLFSEYEQFSSATEILLIDAYTGTSQNIKTNPEYLFNITSDGLSKGDGRFSIVFKAASILPINFITSSAKAKLNTVDVSWKVATEVNISSYIIERSTDGRTFSQVGKVVAKGSTNSTIDYNFNDNQPVSGTVYYRIKALDKNGEVRYSPLMKLKLGSSPITLSLYPNPVKHQLNVFVNNPSSSRYSLKVTTVNGRLIATKNNIQLSDNMIRLNTTGYASGLYILELTDDKGEKLIDKFIK